MHLIKFLTFVIFGYALTSCVMGDEQAMLKCQETHSYSTCAYSIHR